jgi:tetratricopeptide (TPR) repeat protein
MPRNERFGKLLSEGIISVSMRKDKTVKAVEQEIAQELGFASHTVERWRRGYIPKEPEQVAFLIQYCVKNGRVDRSWAESMLIQARYYDRETLLKELFRNTTQHHELPAVYQNLPSRHGDFLGRSKDIERVLYGLASRYHLISIEGMGGIGKTTLAIEVAHKCLIMPSTPLEQSFEGIVWVSAKAHPEKKLWLNEVLDTTARVLDYLFITQLEPEQKRFEVNKLLRTHRVLLIIDNFETIEDPDLEQWMREEVPEPSKVLITSRHTQMRSVWPIHLQGLEVAEALELIRRHAERLNLWAVEVADQKLLLPLIEVTEGNPKAIEMALGHIKYSGLNLEEIVNHLHNAHQTVNDIFSFLFLHTWDVLTEDARSVLLVISFFGETASKEALGAAADLTGYRLDKALGQLVEMSLLDAKDDIGKIPQRYSIHPLIRAFANDQLRKIPQWRHDAQQRWVTWYRKFLSQYDPNNEDWPTYAILDEERDNVLTLLEWSIAANHGTLLPVMQSFWNYLYIRGYWLQCESYSRQALAQADGDGNVAVRLWLDSHLSWLLVEREGTEQEAIQRLHRVEDEIVALGRPELLEETQVLNYLGQAYIWQGNLQLAETYQSRFLSMAEQTGNRRSVLVAHYYLLLIQVHRGNLDGIQQEYLKWLEEAQHIGYERAEGYFTYRLARVLIEAGQFEEAQNRLEQVLTMANRWKEPLLQAHALMGRSQLLWKQGDVVEANRLACAALEAYRRLGSREVEDAAEQVTRTEKMLSQKQV